MGRGSTSGLRGVNMQRVSRIAGGIGLAAAALVVMMVGWSRMNQPVPAPSVQPAEGRVRGDLTGLVGRVDQKARTVEVGEKLGMRPITMTVTDDTAITVRAAIPAPPTANAGGRGASATSSDGLGGSGQRGCRRRQRSGRLAPQDLAPPVATTRP